MKTKEVHYEPQLSICGSAPVNEVLDEVEVKMGTYSVTVTVKLGSLIFSLPSAGARRHDGLAMRLCKRDCSKQTHLAGYKGFCTAEGRD